MEARFYKIGKNGFELAEAIVVLAIVSLLIAIAIPSFLHKEINNNEVSAISSLKAIVSAAKNFRAVNPNYPKDLSGLSASIDSSLAAGAKDGYNFNLKSSANTFSIVARPQNYRVTGIKSFFADESGLIHWTRLDAEATAKDQAL